MDLFTDPIFSILKSEPSQGEHVYLVGGSVRDAFLGKHLKDFDFTCVNGIQFGRRIANNNNFDFYILDKDYDACRVIRTTDTGEKVHYDFNGFRKPTLEQDLLDRDFSINSIAIQVNSEKLIDPAGGLNDLREKVIRLSSVNSLASDPVRILRAIRFSTSLGFRMDKGVIEGIRASKNKLLSISFERLRDEIFKILDGPNPYLALQLIEKLDLLSILFPELDKLKEISQSPPHVNDVWTHTKNVIKHLSAIIRLSADDYDEELANADYFNGLLVLKLGKYREKLRAHFAAERSESRTKKADLFFTALFHDVNKPEARTVEENGRIRFLGHDVLSSVTARIKAEQLRLSGAEADSISNMIKNHMRIHSMVSRKSAGKDLTPKAIYRFFKDCKQDGIDLVILALADTRATYEHTLKQETWKCALDISTELLDAWYEKKDLIISPPPLINGVTLIKGLGCPPGPIVGEILELIRENQVSGKITSEKEAMDFALEYFAQKKADGKL